MSKGERPPKPTGGEAFGFVPTLWRLTEECWHQNPDRRPDIDNVLRRFQAVVDAGKCVDVPLVRFDTWNFIGDGVEQTTPMQSRQGSESDTPQRRINRLDQARPLAAVRPPSLISIRFTGPRKRINT